MRDAQPASCLTTKRSFLAIGASCGYLEDAETLSTLRIKREANNYILAALPNSKLRYWKRWSRLNSSAVAVCF